MDFYQDGPELYNQYNSNKILRHYLATFMPDNILNSIEADLNKFGNTVIKEVKVAGDDAMDNEPELTNFDAWGRRIDEIEVSEGWERLHEIAAEEGLISIGYRREYDEYSRLYQFSKLFMYTPFSAIYTCPLAMADGATKLIETHAADELQHAYEHLISDDPNEFWVAGQWMTEREGGSDVSNTSTIARIEGNDYLLSGDKWFTSAATASMAMTLARIEEDGEISPGGKGLSLFFLETRDDKGDLNGIKINKLKDKLGTRALPTAELTLEDTRAKKIGPEGKGVKLISTILNMTRIYNAISSVSYMAKGIFLAQDYAKRREAFGKKLIDLPLHKQTLVDMKVEYYGDFLLVFYLVELLGKSELGKSTEEENKILRFLTPLAKLYTGKKSIEIISEVLESIGGVGYLEEAGFPSMLRDAQVFSIWEGTTNVLSLDVLRAIYKEDSLSVLMAHIESYITNQSTDLDIQPIVSALSKIAEYGKEMTKNDRNFSETGARKFSFSLARTTIAYLFVRFYSNLVDSDFKKQIKIIYSRWLSQGLCDLINPDEEFQDHNDIIIR